MKEEVDEVVDNYHNDLDEDTDGSFNPPALCFCQFAPKMFFFNQNIRNDPPLQLLRVRNFSRFGRVYLA